MPRLLQLCVILLSLFLIWANVEVEDIEEIDLDEEMTRQMLTRVVAEFDANKVSSEAYELAANTALDSLNEATVLDEIRVVDEVSEEASGVEEEVEDGEKEDNDVTETEVPEELVEVTVDATSTEEAITFEEELPGPAEAARHVAVKEPTLWELVKEQVRNDWAPLLAVIPRPVKTAISSGVQAASKRIGTIVLGATGGLLASASRILRWLSVFLHQASDTLEALAVTRMDATAERGLAIVVAEEISNMAPSGVEGVEQDVEEEETILL